MAPIKPSAAYCRLLISVSRKGSQIGYGLSGGTLIFNPNGHPKFQGGFGKIFLGTYTTPDGLKLTVLKKIHEFGIIHRDIKPENIMITPDGEIKVIDLGALGDEWANPIFVTPQGTPGYASPAVSKKFLFPDTNGIKPHHSNDTFSIGIMLYEMMTGGMNPQDPENKWQTARDTYVSAIALRDGSFPTLSALFDQGRIIEGFTKEECESADNLLIKLLVQPESICAADALNHEFIRHIRTDPNEFNMVCDIHAPQF